MIFEEKSRYILLNDQIFIRWNFLDNMCIVNIYFLANDVIYFEINLTFFIKRFSYVNNKSMNIWLS